MTITCNLLRKSLADFIRYLSRLKHLTWDRSPTKELADQTMKGRDASSCRIQRLAMSWQSMIEANRQDSNFNNQGSGSWIPPHVGYKDGASGVGPLVNSEGNAGFCGQIMERHRGGVDLIRIRRIWKTLSLVKEILDPRSGM